LPLSAGSTWTCDGSVFPALPALCISDVLETKLDENRQFTSYVSLDVSAQMDAIGASMGGG
jgi:hypothetical protein